MHPLATRHDNRGGASFFVKIGMTVVAYADTAVYLVDMKGVMFERVSTAHGRRSACPREGRVFGREAPLPPREQVEFSIKVP